MLPMLSRSRQTAPDTYGQLWNVGPAHAPQQTALDDAPLLRIRRSVDEPRWGTTVSPLPWQAPFMADDKPEPTPMIRVTAALAEFMATVLRHLRTGQGNPWKNWAWIRQRTRYGTGGRISQVQEHRTRRGREVTNRPVEVARDMHGMILFGMVGADAESQGGKAAGQEVTHDLENHCHGNVTVGSNPTPSALTSVNRF